MLKTDVAKDEMSGRIKRMRDVLRAGKIQIRKYQRKLDVLENQIEKLQIKFEKAISGSSEPYSQKTDFKLRHYLIRSWL